MRRPPSLLPALALAALALAPLARASEEPGAPPTIYKWVDANGVAHYTTDLSRVPRSVRGTVRALGGRSATEGRAESEGLAASDREPAVAPPAEPPPEWDTGDAPVPPPRAPAPAGPERWADSDRPFDVPPEEGGGAAPESQTAAVAAADAEPALSAEDRALRLRDLDARIATLEADIASDEDALKGFLAVPAPEDPAQIAYDDTFREVAERLPRRLAELRSLQGERAQLDQP
jgi:hypothetical protein